MARVSNAIIASRKTALLGRLVARGCLEKEDFVEVSLKELGRDLGLSKAELRTALRSLERERLMETFPRRLPNGGQLANAYRLTDEGMRFLTMKRSDEDGDAVGFEQCRK